MTSRGVVTRVAAAGWLLAAVLMACSPSLLAGEEESRDARLESLLDRLDRIAARYRDNALKFSCHERITFYPGTPHPRVHDLEYIYLYDKQNGLQDYRTETSSSSRKGRPAREVALGELGLPSVVLRAYSVIFVFERSKGDMYDYAILRQEKTLGRDAVVVRFDAVPPYKKDYNDWFGVAWVDLETSQLLKVEALKADQHEEELRFEADLAGTATGPPRRPRDYTIERITTEFSVEQKGMRLPGRVVTRKLNIEVEERDGVRRPVEHELFRVEQEYSNYRFYGVKAYEQFGDSADDGKVREDPP